MSSIIEQIAEYLGADPRNVKIEMTADYADRIMRATPPSTRKNPAKGMSREERERFGYDPAKMNAEERERFRHEVLNPSGECSWGICKNAAPRRKAGDPCPFGGCHRVPPGFEDGGDIHFSAETRQLDAQLEKVDMEKLGPLMMKHGIRSVRF